MKNAAEINKNFTGLVIAQNSIFNILGYIVPLLFAVLLIPFIIKYLGQEKFGILSLIWVFIGYFSFFDFGVGRALTKIVSEQIGNDNESEVASLFWTSMYILLFVSLPVTIVLFYISPTLVYSTLDISISYQNDTLNSFYLLALSTPLIISTAGIRGFLEAYHKFKIINIIRILQGISTFLIPIICLVFTKKLLWIVFFMVLLRFLVWGLYYYQCYNSNNEIIKISKVSYSNLKRVLSISGWMTISNFVSPLIVYIDRFFIGSLVSATAIAYYTSPYEIVLKLLVIPGAIAGVIFPIISANHLNDISLVKNLVKRTMKYILIILVPISVIIFIYANEALLFWLGPDFANESTIIVQLFSVGLIFNSVAYIPFYFLEGIGRPDITAKIQLVEFFPYLALLYSAINEYGIKGAAIVWLLRIVIDLIILLIFTKSKLFDDKSIMFSKSFIYLMIISIVSFFIVLISDLIIKILFTFLFIIIFGVFVWNLILNEEEKINFSNLICRKN